MSPESGISGSTGGSSFNGGTMTYPSIYALSPRLLPFHIIYCILLK